MHSVSNKGANSNNDSRSNNNTAVRLPTTSSNIRKHTEVATASTDERPRPPIANGHSATHTTTGTQPNSPRRPWQSLSPP
eukprot:4724324-Alexandrium_andersonii.AAC.1